MMCSERSRKTAAPNRITAENVGTAGAQSAPAAFMKSENPMDAGAVEKHEANENDRADDNGGGEGELIGDLTQVICWA